MNIIGRTFATKKEEIEFLHKHQREIIELKKAAVKFTDGSIFFDKGPEQPEQINAFKSLHTSKENDTDTIIKRTIIGNTYNWLDSHGDVHLDGTFSQSIKQRGTKIFHLHDHEQKVTAKVGAPTDVYEETVKWRDLNIDKSGTTTALMMDSEIKASLNKTVFMQYKNGEIDQHSVGMYYVKMAFATNDPDYKEAYAEWNAHIDKIGNKEKAEENGYFYAIKEAKLIEISAVLQGSNELTPTVEAKNIEEIEPPKDTQKIEPLKNTHKTESGKGSVHYY